MSRFCRGRLKDLICFMRKSEVVTSYRMTWKCLYNIFTAMKIYITVFWNKILCSLISGYPYSGGTYELNLMVEDRGSMFLQNGIHLPDYMLW
jgi:hypothetical protein